MSTMPTRDEAFLLLRKTVRDESLLRHCLSVESGMRGVAKALGEDVALWTIAGILHDIDYEVHPEDHPIRGVEWLREYGLPDSLVHAVAAHGSERTGVAKETPFDWALSGVDELTGLVITTALVRPSKVLADVKVKSVKKKMKDKAFAKAVNRQAIKDAAEALGMELSDFISAVLEAMKEDHEALGL